jgi:hypothetical protein
VETSTTASIQLLDAHRVFSLEQAQSLVPLIRRITRAAFEQIERRLPQLTHAEGAKREELEGEVHAIFDAWQEKLRRLGGVTKGMWLVDFDNGEGYYCWRYPETEIAHFHGYKEGFLGRTKLQ